MGFGAWEHELSFDPASKVEFVPEMAELKKLPPNMGSQTWVFWKNSEYS